MKAIFVLISLTGLLVSCSCDLICPSGWTLDNRSCYVYIDSADQWYGAELNCGLLAFTDFCLFDNGHLVSITSAEENNFVYALRNSFQPAPSSDYWIGLGDISVEGTYVWSDGSTFSYTNWSPDQPDNNPVTADCVAQWDRVPGRWDDQPCTRSLPYVCEVPAKKVCRPLVVISNRPEMKARESPLYVYAIESTTGPTPSEISFEKTFPSSAIRSGLVEADGITWGCYLQVNLLIAKGTAYGTYSATSKSQDGLHEVNMHTFVKPYSKVLNTRGMYTLTVYRDSSNAMEVEDGKYVMVPFSPKCLKIIWKNDKKRIVNVGTRFKVVNVEQAGIYTIYRQGRKQRGWFVQVEIIVASCPEGQVFINDACTPVSLTCKNGGVLSDCEIRCICPPYFTGEDCSSRVEGYEDFTIGFAVDKSLRCRDLIGGNPTCKGHLFCMEGLFGCKCAPGWKGNKCDRACYKGRWGADCNQKCPSENRDCNRFFGL